MNEYNPFAGCTRAELRTLRNQLDVVRNRARDHGYNRADHELGEMLADVMDALESTFSSA